MWVVVTSVDPVRSYLFKGGVLPFGKLRDDGTGNATCSPDGEAYTKTSSPKSSWRTVTKGFPSSKKENPHCSILVLKVPHFTP